MKGPRMAGSGAFLPEAEGVINRKPRRAPPGGIPPDGIPPDGIPAGRRARRGGVRFPTAAKRDILLCAIAHLHREM